MLRVSSLPIFLSHRLWGVFFFFLSWKWGNIFFQRNIIFYLTCNTVFAIPRNLFFFFYSGVYIVLRCVHLSHFNLFASAPPAANEGLSVIERFLENLVCTNFFFIFFSPFCNNKVSLTALILFPFITCVPEY